jgi:GR25 family glycosyltransferase involved in LPS biosynthesis
MSIDVIYINLSYREDRKQNMEMTLPILGYPITRFEAHRPTKDEILTGKYSHYFVRSIKRIRNYLYDEATLSRAYGIFGVYASQYDIHQSRIGNPNNYIIVEDDAVVSPETAERLDFLSRSEHIPSDWDMIRNIWSDEGDQTLDLHKFMHCHEESKFADKFSHGRFGGAHFSLCKGSSAQKIVNYLDSDYFYAIDSAYSTSRLNVYHTNLGVKIGDYGTDIPKDSHTPEPNENGPVCHIA